MKPDIHTNILARTAAALSALSLVLSSCIAEDTSHCPPPGNVRLTVTTDYELGMESRGAARREWYAGQIDNVTVWVFDQNGLFITSWTGGPYTMGEQYRTLLYLEGGRSYDFIAWTNFGDRYYTSPGDGGHKGLTREEVMLGMSTPADGVIRDDIPHRHHGMIEGAAVAATGESSHTLVLDPHTYKVNFIVRGVAQRGKHYEAVVVDRNRRHTVDGEWIGGVAGDTYRHVRTMLPTEADSGVGETVTEMASSMILLQMGDDSATSFEVVNTTDGEPLWPGTDLLETIKTAYRLSPEGLAQMLDDVYEYDIIVSGGAFGVEVEVKAWGYRDNPKEL